jgi:Fe-S-cluster containining protein
MLANVHLFYRRTSSMTRKTHEPLPWDEVLRQAFARPRAMARQFAHGMRTPAEAWALLEQLHSAADEAVQQWPQRQEHACAPGCFFCCFLWTDAMPLEVLRIADHLQRTASPDDLAEIRRRLRERLSAPPGQHPCGLLTAEGRCAVYDIRPMTCRGFHSFSKAACQASYEGYTDGPTTALDEPLHMLVAAMQEGIERGLAESGSESGWVELNAALLHALDRPASLASWLNGEPIFPRLSE